MPTQEKVAAVEDLKTRFDGVTTMLLTEYRGLTVQQISELRRQLRGVAAEYKVVKNRLARRALAGAASEGLAQGLRGPTGVILSRKDPVAVTKALHAFARAHQALVIKGGFVEGEVLPAEELRALAELPGREALRGQVVGAVQGPLAQLVGLLSSVQRDLAYVLAERGRGAADE